MGMLDGRTAILIGASSGVGYGAALRFAEEGATVIAGARRLEKLQALKEDAAQRGFPGEIVPVRCDIEQEADLDNIVNVCIEHSGKVDILACIAQGALNDMRSFEETDLDNLLAFYKGGPGYTLQIIQKCLPYMKKAGYGRILTCASGAGERYTPHSCAYGMAKAAIINLTHVCAQELGKYGIVTNCFLPVITNDYFENESNDAAIPVPIMQALSPVGKLGKAYADGSPLLAFLASEAAGYINGQIISICGGISYASPATAMEALSKLK